VAACPKAAMPDKKLQAATTTTMPYEAKAMLPGMHKHKQILPDKLTYQAPRTIARKLKLL
jgi:hypothetical protein